jgi:hypothetical protein
MLHRLLLFILELHIANRVVGGMPRVYRTILDLFWPQSEECFNLERVGVRIPVGQSTVLVRGRFAAWLGDERVLKDSSV